LLYNSQFVPYLSLLILLEDTYSVYLPGHPLLYNSQFVSARVSKIQIDCYITMDDQEGIQNLYPPTRQARAGKIQIDCYITMDVVIHCYITVNLYLTCPCSSSWRIHILYTFLVIHCYITVNLYLNFPCLSCWRIHILARAGKIQIDCYITMDDQERIQNMYPPT
jgi:hypothetical protein